MKRRQQHKKFVKETATRNDQALEKLLALVEYYGDLRQGSGRAQATGRDTEHYKKKAQQILDDIKEHATPYMSYTAYDGKEEFDESGVESNGWFDDNGYLVKPIPGACVVDCSGSGRKDDEVDHWMRELGFDIGLPVAKAVQFLKEFGAWDDLDLLAEVASTGDIRKMRQWIADNGNDMDDRAHFDAAQMAKRVLAQRILWEFCNEIRDQAYDTSEEDLESVGLSGYIGDWNDEDWVKFQTELSWVSL